MRRFSGGCHCGNLGFELVWPLDGDELAARACGCSFCTKHRGAYASHPEARLEVVVRDPDLVSRYRFGTGTAEFWVCARCGVVPVVTSTIDQITYAVVNVNTFAEADPVTFRTAVTTYDDENAQERLDRRRRTWIRDVVVKGEGAH
jgi:hypothetical protein